MTPVLICGAGPTGLVLALRLARCGVRVRIIDERQDTVRSSRALVVHARTLEFYRQMGIADDFVARGLRFDAANLWVRARPVARVQFGELARGESPYPFMMVMPQDRHEAFLVEHLRAAGVEVERGTALIDFEQHGDHVAARLRTAAGVEQACLARYLAGCDGARSRTRQVLGIDFAGRTYGHVFFVADVDAGGPVMNDELHVALDDSDLLAVFPLRGNRTARLVGTVCPLEADDGAELRWEDVSKRLLERLDIRVERVNWFSTYRVHHRVAARFGHGRVFLLGDAAHIHSPVGGQGMNTGIGDAVNLAWKLADVLQGRAGPALLDSFEPERIRFARRLVATTDRWFVFVTNPGRIARFVRARIVPLLAPLLMRIGAVRRFMFRVLSQIAIHYRHCALSAGAAGRVRGGDRLPWAGVDDHDGRHWLVRIHGTASAALEHACRDLGLALQVVPWRDELHRAGLRRDALYLLRPDGHAALADPTADAGTLVRFANTVFLPRAADQNATSVDHRP